MIDNVDPIYNELGITNSPSFTEKASDTLLTGRVKAGLVEIRELSANSFKVVSERATVYLMGRVTQREADQATEVARTTKGATARGAGDGNPDRRRAGARARAK